MSIVQYLLYELSEGELDVGVKDAQRIVVAVHELIEVSREEPLEGVTEEHHLRRVQQCNGARVKRAHLQQHTHR